MQKEPNFVCILKNDSFNMQNSKVSRAERIIISALSVQM